MYRFALRSGMGRSTTVGLAVRFYQAAGAARVERQVEGAPAAAPAAAAAPQAPSPAELERLKVETAKVDPARIDKLNVWGLWNEGNLYSLSVPELAAFLMKESVTLGPLRKSGLVRQVEEIISKFSQPTTKNVEDTVASITASLGHETVQYNADTTELFDEADEYGDWGADPNFEEKRGVDFMCLSQKDKRSSGRMIRNARKEATEHLGSHAFQLLHEAASSEVGLARFSPSKLPGCGHLKEAFSPIRVDPSDANRVAFRQAFRWSANSLWNLGLDGEINIGAGKALYWRSVAKRNRSVLPTWTCQEHLCTVHPFSWFAVAMDSNVPVVEKLAADLGMTLTSAEPERSYKVMVTRSRDILDIELNGQLTPIKVEKPWERILITHYLRNCVPDLRFCIRARKPMRRKVAESYMESKILQFNNNTVTSILGSELGDVAYACLRERRRWTTRLDTGVQLSILETKRIPAISTKPGEDTERLEYEFIANIPQQVEKVDLTAMADDLWARGNQLASLMEEGMAELQAHTMSSSAAFEPVFRAAPSSAP